MNAWLEGPLSEFIDLSNLFTKNFDVTNFMTYQVFNAILNVQNCFSLTSLQW